MSLGPGNRSIRRWIPFAATFAMQSYSRIMRELDCFRWYGEC
jgi:hypothetical protein